MKSPHLLLGPVCDNSCQPELVVSGDAYDDTTDNVFHGLLGLHPSTRSHCSSSAPWMAPIEGRQCSSEPPGWPAHINSSCLWFSLVYGTTWLPSHTQAKRLWLVPARFIVTSPKWNFLMFKMILFQVKYSATCLTATYTFLTYKQIRSLKDSESLTIFRERFAVILCTMLFFKLLIEHILIQFIPPQELSGTYWISSKMG